MSNSFAATDDFFASMDVVDAVAISILTPAALMPANLRVTNAISCATVVLISGFFENYLKDITRELIISLNALSKPLACVPYEMKAKHFQSGAKALKWLISQDKKMHSTARSDDLMRRLGSLSNSTNWELAWEAFADTNSNPDSEAVKGILSGLLVEETWNEINGLTSQHGQLNTFLSSFIQTRNVCAHSGTHSTPPTGQHLLDYTLTFRALAECIDLLLGVQREKYQQW